MLKEFLLFIITFDLSILQKNVILILLSIIDLRLFSSSLVTPTDSIKYMRIFIDYWVPRAC